MTDKPRSPGAVAPQNKKLDPHQIVDAKFVAGAAVSSALPPPTTAEIAFAGRSNVGKSSLINSLVERKGLVRTGATPGVTRQINLFEARARDGAVFNLIDLPGYGYSKVSKTERSAWQTLIEKYLRTRVTLAALVLLVDIRRGVEEDDAQLIEFVDEAGSAQRHPVEVIIVATKVDKLGVAARRTALAEISKQARRKILGFSSETGEGRAELWRILRKATFRGVPTIDPE
ncbi:MAG TPA: ribosome biogenesis GTP-binding protein YihA/YsxC [Polyangium sp.]|nr:ribosome biogenesis GTP-binding protein YihA/YsxC [Polyangium sp.]